MNADGISYLDLGDAWARGDWTGAVNAYWSPMYSWLLKCVTSLASLPNESTAAHIANLFALALALLGFELFWDELWKDTTEPVRDGVRECTAGVVLLWAAIVLVGVALITPDLLVVGFALVAFALMQRAIRAQAPREFVFFGLVLAAGYYAKSAMFLVAIMSLTSAALATWRMRRPLRAPLYAVAAFVGAAAPLVIALTMQKGRPTFGDSGRINYAFYINGVNAVSHWRGGPMGSGEPAHATREIFSDPHAFEFVAPIGGTYAPWYDPSYWYEGLRVHPDVRAHGRRVRAHLPLYLQLFWPPVVALGVVLALGGASRRTLRALVARWPVLLATFGALTMYVLVYVEERYIGAFVLAVYLCVLSSMRVTQSRAVVVPLACLVLAWAPSRALYGSADRDLYTSTALLRGVWHDENDQWNVAQALRAAGVPDGARLAFIGTGTHVYWARLLHARVVTEVPWREVMRFWERGPVAQDSLFNRMVATSAATFAVTGMPPARFDIRGWTPLGVQGLLVRPLQASHEVQAPVKQQVRGKGIQAESLAAERRP